LNRLAGYDAAIVEIPERRATRCASISRSTACRSPSSTRRTARHQRSRRARRRPARAARGCARRSLALGRRRARAARRDARGRSCAQGGNGEVTVVANKIDLAGVQPQVRREGDADRPCIALTGPASIS
jgi:hypothetical protein